MIGGKRSGPVEAGERITNLDAVRGVAVLGILTMNAVAYGIPDGYFNLEAAGSNTWLDWFIGGAGEILFDQKFMGLFSLLFGAGIVLFADRAAAKARRPVWLSLWRNLLLLAIGIAHTAAWDGDVLVLYALCAPLVIALRRRPPAVLIAAGTLLVLSAAGAAVWAQTTVDDPINQIGGGYWLASGTKSAAVGSWFLYDVFVRALGMMLIGAALYRSGVLDGARNPGFYRRMALIGLGVGLPLSALGLAIVAASGFSADVALAGSAPNTVCDRPDSPGLLGADHALERPAKASADSRLRLRLRLRVRAVGRMALTNYLTQTALGLIVLGGLFGAVELTRTSIAVFVVAVWALQLWWSQAWLDRFRYGPVEWLWRCATYRPASLCALRHRASAQLPARRTRRPERRRLRRRCHTPRAGARAVRRLHRRSRSACGGGQRTRPARRRTGRLSPPPHLRGCRSPR